MIIYTGEIQILRLAIDKEITALRNKGYDLSDPDYNYTAGKVATLYRIYNELQQIQVAVQGSEDAKDAEIKVRKSYH